MEKSLFYAAVIAFCLTLSFLFSGMEAGVFALSRLRIRQQRRAGRYAAQVLHGYLENPENFLWTILIGNTVATFTAFGLVIVELHRFLARQPVLFAFLFVALAFLFYALGDLLPKMFFRQFPNRLCLMLAIPFRFVHLALSPLVGVVTWFSRRLQRVADPAGSAPVFGTRSELRWVMQESAQTLTTEERAMINRVLDLQNLTVSSVAIGLNQVTSISVQTALSEVISLCRERQLTRLPVWEADGVGRRFIGVVSLRTVLYDPDLDPSRPARSHVKPALYLREDLRLEEAFRRMQRRGHRLAVVTGRDQREVGIVSLEDILKAIFGEVRL